MGHVESLLAQLPDDFPCARALQTSMSSGTGCAFSNFHRCRATRTHWWRHQCDDCDPGIVSGTAVLVKAANSNVRVLCGAGVKNGADVAGPLTWELKACF